MSVVSEYRNKIISGTFIDLVPLKKEHFVDVVRIRNQEKSKYFLNQNFDLTEKMQSEWYEEYLKRDNDIYWVICDKQGTVIGTERLYYITSDSCEEGSTIIDEAFAMKGPYSVETILLAMDFAFEVLKVKTIVNTDREDNKNMNSISQKVGFSLIKKIEIRGVPYNYYELSSDHYKRSKLLQVIGFWKKLSKK